ncbi:MAG: phosphate ABC transporter permease PstA [Phycisphaerales bacterium]
MNASPTPKATAPSAPIVRRGRPSHEGGTVLAAGEPIVWLLAGGLGLAVAMISGLLALILVNGAATFWPGPIDEVRTLDGVVHLGERSRTDRFRPSDEILEGLPETSRAAADAELEANDGYAARRLIRTANFDLTGSHFTWVDDFEIEPEGVTQPEWAVAVERLEWGRFYGFPERAELGDETVAEGPEATWRWYEDEHAQVRRLWRERRGLETHEIGAVNRRLEQARLRLRQQEMRDRVPPEWVSAWSDLERARQGGDEASIAEAEAKLESIEAAGFVPPESFLEAVRRYESEERDANREFSAVRERIAALNEEMARYRIVFRTIDGAEKAIPLAEIVRATPQNRIDVVGKLATYLSRWSEFLLDDPRESNSEGGVFPAIFGTVAMTLVMTLIVVPFGVLAALYLREYAKAGPLITAVRIAVNNLAGVPSIVFGVFGLGFFCYVVGGSIDEVFFSEKLPNPTYGKGGLVWASLTLALLTLPVVIVATEEALAAVPRSMREGSYACGASKWQTIRRIVLPRALPGIMTGAILAMARGAGEVAPLMLVGAVKLAPELPVDGVFPFVHPERSFMHLGFHIYDLGFQSQNSEAAKPMVFTTTLLLIALVALLNLMAIWLRARLRRRFAGSQF